MSKGIISYDFGHMEGGEDTSANGILYEYSVVRNYGSVVVKELQKAGYTLVNCTPSNGKMNLGQSLSYRVNKANSSSSMLHLCFHANCYNGNAYGCEMEVASDSSARIGQSIQNEVVSSLGFFNRGVKRPSLYVTRNTNMPCVLTEPFFIDNRGDCNKYNAEKLGCAIATGVLKALGNNYRPSTSGNNSSSSSSPSKPTAVVTASALNVREKKSTSSKILGTLVNGKSVEVYKVEGDWIHIYYPPNGGFIAKQYVKLYNIPNSMIKKPENNPVEKKEEIKVKNIICYQYGLDENAAEYLGDFLNCSTIETHRPYDYKNVENIFAVGGDKKAYTSYLNTLISGSDANNTFERTIGYILTKRNIKWNVTKYNISQEEKNTKNKIVIYNNYVDKRAAEYLAAKLNCPSRENKNINATNYDFIYLVGDDKDAPQSSNVRNIKGQDRYLTAKETIDFMKFI